MLTMKVTRKLDELGRIVLPQDIRTSLGLFSMNEMDIGIEDGRIIIELHNPTCVICGSQNDKLREVENKHLCIDCISKVKSLS